MWHGETMKFSILTEAFEEIAQLSSRIAMTKRLAALFQNASEKEIQIIAYLSLGKLRPPYQGHN